MNNLKNKWARLLAAESRLWRGGPDHPDLDRVEIVSDHSEVVRYIHDGESREGKVALRKGPWLVVLSTDGAPVIINLCHKTLGTFRAVEVWSNGDHAVIYDRNATPEKMEEMILAGDIFPDCVTSPTWWIDA